MQNRFQLHCHNPFKDLANRLRNDPLGGKPSKDKRTTENFKGRSEEEKNRNAEVSPSELPLYHENIQSQLGRSLQG